MADLFVLDLRENRLGDRGAQSLADSPHLRNLAHLELSQNSIEDDGADALAESPYLGCVRILLLASEGTSSWDTGGVEELLARMPRLERLFCGVRFTDTVPPSGLSSPCNL